MCIHREVERIAKDEVGSVSRYDSAFAGNELRKTTKTSVKHSVIPYLCVCKYVVSAAEITRSSRFVTVIFNFEMERMHLGPDVVFRTVLFVAFCKCFLPGFYHFLSLESLYVVENQEMTNVCCKDTRKP
jgi:hypothetical protein